MSAKVFPAIQKHTSTIIVAHGLGDSGAGWSFLADHLRNKFQETKFVFPNAPQIPITVNGGVTMRGWYDISDFGDLANRTDDEAGIKRSQQYFHSLIAEEVKAGISSERIVIGGFSQGGAMSLVAGITAPQKLGGIFGLSCYLLLKDKLMNQVPTDNVNKETKIFMAHGTADPVVKYQFGQMSAAQLKAWGYDVDFKSYPGLPHSAAPEELDDLEAYLAKIVPDLGEKKEASL